MVSAATPHILTAQSQLFHTGRTLCTRGVATSGPGWATAIQAHPLQPGSAPAPALATFPPPAGTPAGGWGPGAGACPALPAQRSSRGMRLGACPAPPYCLALQSGNGVRHLPLSARLVLQPESGVGVQGACPSTQSRGPPKSPFLATPLLYTVVQHKGECTSDSALSLLFHRVCVFTSPLHGPYSQS